MAVKAFEVTDTARECGELVFADSPARAKKESDLYQSGDFEWTDLRVRRTPEMDKYATVGHVSDRQRYDEGWNVYCNHCFDVVWDEPGSYGLVFVGDRAYHEGCVPQHTAAQQPSRGDGPARARGGAG